MLCILPLLTFTACDFINGLRNLPGTEGGQFTAYRNQVTKDEFQKQYAQAFNSLQPDYTKDFVYTYTNDSKEIHKNGEDKQTTNARTEYDADSEIILYHYRFQNNDPGDPADESYFWEYREENGMLRVYDSRTNNAQTRTLGFAEFWEFAHSQVPLILFPNPNKLYNDATYYIDLNEDGDKVFTLYSGDENDYSLRQIVFSGTEMLYRTKRYNKEDSYEDTIIDIYRVYNETVTLTPHP
jgi:hypothetical protein